MVPDDRTRVPEWWPAAWHEGAGVGEGRHHVQPGHLLDRQPGGGGQPGVGGQGDHSGGEEHESEGERPQGFNMDKVILNSEKRVIFISIFSTLV